MNDVFVLQNQHKQILGKNGEWLDGRTINAVFRCTNKDEALNQQFECGSKDYSLRIHLLRCELSPQKHPIIADDDLPNVHQLGNQHSETETAVDTDKVNL